VTLLGGSGFEVFDPHTGQRLAAVDLPEAGSVEVIFNAAGTKAYISQMETASVYEVDVASRSVLRRLDTEGVWTKVIVLSPDELTLWAANWVSNDVSEIDLTTGEVWRRFATVTTPRGLYVTPDGARMYVAGFENGEIQVFDLASLESEVIYRSGGAMRHLVGDPEHHRVYASDMARAHVLEIDTVTNEVTELAVVDRVPNTIDLSPDGRMLFVSNRGRNNSETYYKPGPEWGSVVVVDTATGAYLDALVGGNQTTGLDVSPDGTMLAFSDFLDNRVTVYTIPSYEDLAAGGGGRWEAHLQEIRK
jgi:DNA-binding beta-propeller fold protein YncE